MRDNTDWNKLPPLAVRVLVYETAYDLSMGKRPMRDYIINHNDPRERAVLGQQCRNVFESRTQVIVTTAMPNSNSVL